MAMVMVMMVVMVVIVAAAVVIVVVLMLLVVMVVAAFAMLMVVMVLLMVMVVMLMFLMVVMMVVLMALLIVIMVMVVAGALGIVALVLIVIPFGGLGLSHQLLRQGMVGHGGQNHVAGDLIPGGGAVSYTHLDVYKRQVPGVGPARKAALLKQFKSIKAIRAATAEQLGQTIGPAAGQKVYDYFHKED